MSTACRPIGAMKRTRVAAIAAAFLAGATAAWAEEPIRFEYAVVQPAEAKPADPVEDSGWRFGLAFYLWLPGVSGDIGAGPFTLHTNADFIDVVEDSDSVFGLSGRLAVEKGPWGGFVNANYLKVGVDDAGGLLGQLDVTAEMIFVEFAAKYRVHEWDLGDGRGLRLDVYGGGRYSDLDLEFEPGVGPGVKQGEDWVDPIIGAWVDADLSERWRARFEGDIGGFGAGSEFSWSATGLIGYDFTLFSAPWTVYGGYRALGQDFEDGSFRWDVVLHGPVLGLFVGF